MITLAEQAVLAGCDRRDKYRVPHFFRERKGHQCTVRLAFTLDTQYRIGLLIGQLLDSIRTAGVSVAPGLASASLSQNSGSSEFFTAFSPIQFPVPRYASSGIGHIGNRDSLIDPCRFSAV